MFFLTGITFGAPTDTWPFNPAKDDFSSSALLDLRTLNEKEAGISGFVRTNDQGQLILGDGRPARFWAVNSDTGGKFIATPLGRKDEPSLERQARFLAKRGVNMVRLFFFINPKSDQTLDQTNDERIDWAKKAVAAYKKEGIYTLICPYWSASAKSGPSWGLDENGGKETFGLLFFDEKLQEAYKGWLKKLLTTPNPYGRTPLYQDPALAIIQIQNEDSLLFWTFGTIKGQEKKKLAKLYGDFLKQKYGSVEKAFAKWNDAKQPLDDAAAGTADFCGTYELTIPRPKGGRQVRLSDQLQFITEKMYYFNEKTAAYLHKDLGCKQVINPGNWITASPILLNDAERLSYTAGDVLAVNRYFGGVHNGKNNGWAIVNGDIFTNPSILDNPQEFPISLKQVQGKPMMVTESCWVFPNGRGSEGPFLISAYSSLNGIQAYYWFTTGDDEWTPPCSANGYMPSQKKWIFATPDILGTFPGASLMYRLGYIKQGDPAVVEHRGVDDIYAGASPIIAEAATFDPNRQKGSFAPQNNVQGGVDPLAFLVGPVRVVYGKTSAGSQVVDLSRYIDSSKKIAKSITGELEFNGESSYCTVNTSCAQGATAFFSKHPDFRLKDIDITSHNEHGSVLAVSMDGRPISQSSKILVQVSMGCRPSGWVEAPTQFVGKADNQEKKFDGFVVRNYGTAPWMVNQADVNLVVRNSNLRSAKVLDSNGNAVSNLPLEKVMGGVTFKFPTNAIYVILSSQS